MKIAVYAINKNHASSLQKWADCARDADYLVMADTGSDDGSVEAGRAAGITMHEITVNPWRYDVARNMALDLVPEDADLCIALDTDEFLQPGWREHLEQAWAAGVTRPRYRYIWSWRSPGQPGLEFAAEKIHPRHGYVWRHAAHEVLVTWADEVQGWCGLEIHHHQKPQKYRSHELPLLRIAVEEAPDDDRMAYYFARCLFYAGLTQEAEAEFRRHLALPTARWRAERAQSMRFLFKITGDANWLQQATAEAPERREPWVDFAQYCHDNEMWLGCLQAAKKALAIKQKPLDYICEPYAWGSAPHDLAAIAAYRSGFHHEAKFHGLEALKLSPYEQRLVDNLRFYEVAA